MWTPPRGARSFARVGLEQAVPGEDPVALVGDVRELDFIPGDKNPIVSFIGPFAVAFGVSYELLDWTLKAALIAGISEVGGRTLALDELPEEATGSLAARLLGVSPQRILSVTFVLAETMDDVLKAAMPEEFFQKTTNFEPDGGRGVSIAPQQIDHLAIRPHHASFDAGDRRHARPPGVPRAVRGLPERRGRGRARGRRC